MQVLQGIKYENKGVVQGTLAKKPFFTKTGAALIVICTYSPRYNKKTMRTEIVFPNFVTYGKMAEEVMSAQIGQEVRAEYHVETKKVTRPDGSFSHYEDKVITNIALGRISRKRVVIQDEESIEDQQLLEE